MKLKECRELGKAVDLETDDEFIINVNLHVTNLFAYSDIDDELKELRQDCIVNDIDYDNAIKKFNENFAKTKGVNNMKIKIVRKLPCQIMCNDPEGICPHCLKHMTAKVITMKSGWIICKVFPCKRAIKSSMLFPKKDDFERKDVNDIARDWIDEDEKKGNWI